MRELICLLLFEKHPPEDTDRTTGRKLSYSGNLPHLSPMERAVITQLISGMSQINKKTAKQILSSDPSHFHNVDITGRKNYF